MVIQLQTLLRILPELQKLSHTALSEDFDLKSLAYSPHSPTSKMKNTQFCPALCNPVDYTAH